MTLAAIDWLPGGSVAQQIITLGGASVVLVALARWVFKGARLLIAFFQRIDKVVTNVELQLYPNGGASLRDAVNRIQAALAIENVASKSRAADQVAARVAPDKPAPSPPDPPSAVLKQLDNLETTVVDGTESILDTLTRKDEHQ